MTTVRKMGKWIVGQTLGEGGFSKVKLGTHEQTSQKVALKILKKDKLSMDSSVAKQVQREIQAMEKVQHPNVIRLIEVDWDAKYTKKNGKVVNVILVVLELATGGELFEFLSFTGCFEEAVARTYFHQLIAGLEECHTQGIAHRDLKPENLLLDDNFVLKMADFGFANLFEHHAKLMFTECGTPGYMAPEMFGQKGYDAQKCDVWACGVILFIMLAGFPPFQRPNASDWWFDKLKKGKHALFWQAHSRTAYFSEQTKDFINKILNPNPAQRITVAQIQKHPWFTSQTISEAALEAELRRRKERVDEQKAIERMEKKAQQQQHAVASLHGQTVRAIGLESSGFPTAPPTFAYSMHASKKTSDTTTDAAADSAFANASAFGGAPSPFAAAAIVHKPALPYKPDSGVQCYTRFFSELPAHKVIDRVSKVLDSMQGQHSVNNEVHKIKARVVTLTGVVNLQAQVFHEEESKLSVCEFRRRKGDFMQFQQLYEDLRLALDSIVKVKPPAVQSSDPISDTAAAPQ